MDTKQIPYVTDVSWSVGHLDTTSDLQTRPQLQDGQHHARGDKTRTPTTGAGHSSPLCLHRQLHGDSAMAR